MLSPHTRFRYAFPSSQLEAGFKPTCIPIPVSQNGGIALLCRTGSLPSSPVLVARTNDTPWKAPTGPEAYRRLKELRPVGNHPANAVWEEKLAPRVHDPLDSMRMN